MELNQSNEIFVQLKLNSIFIAKYFMIQQNECG